MRPEIAKIFEAGLRTAIPEGALSISRWAETYRYVQRSARPGRWSNAVVPFLTEIMDVVTDPMVRKVVYQKSAQVAGSELLVNIIGYYIHIDPTYIMYVAEKEDKARAWTNESFDTTVQETEVLRDLVRWDSEDNNQRIKRFPGGQLTIGWATSPAELSSRPVRILCFDEVDGYSVTREGDPVKIGEARTKTFSGSEKIILVSSPRNAETSVIEREYMSGDRREYWVPCPHCGDFQTLKWANLRWDDDPAEAYYVCELCGAIIEHDDKPEMLAKGRWIASEKFKGTASFRINELYSPFTTWGAMAVDFLEARKSPDTLKPFVNTRLGETWKEEERIEYADLQLSREDYRAEVPDGVLFLTAGVDVQDDRLEIFLAGWGRDLECWAIDYRVIEGSPAMPQVWDDLTDYLLDARAGETQEFRVAAVCIDSGGHHTQDVYRFAHRYKGRRWFAVKGASVAGKPIVSKPTIVGSNPKVRLYTVGTDTAKDTIFAYLRNGERGTPGYVHFPADDRFDESYLKALCSEKKVTRFRMGQKYQVWEKVTPSARNEPLDTFVYALAAVHILRPNFGKIARKIEAGAVENTEIPAPIEVKNDALEAENSPETPENAPKTAENAPKRRKTRIRIKNKAFGGYKVGY